jgi:FMN reductase
MTLRIAIVVGNPKPKSRTRSVAEKLVEKLFAPSPGAVKVVDLADFAEVMFSWPNATMNSLNESVASQDVVLFASPTYKATYSGLLKSFLDRYPANGLRGVTAIPLLTGGTRDHAMGPTVNLSPLLVELGAVVPGRGTYFVIENMDRLDSILEEMAADYAANLRQLAWVYQGLPSSRREAPDDRQR